MSRFAKRAARWLWLSFVCSTIFASPAYATRSIESESLQPAITLVTQAERQAPEKAREQVETTIPSQTRRQPAIWRWLSSAPPDLPDAPTAQLFLEHCALLN
jgi:hypothetical protein